MESLNNFKRITSIIILFAFVNCQGMIYRKHTEPGLLGDAKTDIKVRACIRSYFGLVTTGNASLEFIRVKNNISKIASIDHEYTEAIFRIVYRRYCVVVTGE